MPRHATQRRSGSAMVYAVVGMTALTGFCSLAVDLGRVHVAKVELQHAADAAARYAAAGLPQGTAEARRRAVDAADDNKADGHAVALDPDRDVEFGVWDEQTRTFTKLSGPAEAGANAMRVTTRLVASRGTAVPMMFARVVGKPSCDLEARCIVMYKAPGPAGIIGLNKIDLGKQAEIAGYNSALGQPGGANVRATANVSSNGTIKVDGGIQGTAKVGPQGSLQGSITGRLTNLPSNLSFAPTDFGSAATVNNNTAIGACSSGRRPLNGTDFKLDNGETITLPAGTYYFTKLELDNQAVATFGAASTVYVNGDIKVANHAEIRAGGNRPANFRIRQGSGFATDISNHGVLTGELYAPGSVLTLGNQGQFNGAVVAKEITGGNHAKLYNDEQLNASNTASIGLVR